MARRRSWKAPRNYPQGPNMGIRCTYGVSRGSGHFSPMRYPLNQQRPCFSEPVIEVDRTELINYLECSILK